MIDLAEQWRKEFLLTVRRREHADPLREASLGGHLGLWTDALTTAAIAVCVQMGWLATARGHLLQRLPVPRNEYLALDVMAFPDSKHRWCFPIAVFELENSTDEDRIAYSVWKVLCVRTSLRVVFCYRRDPEDAPALLKFIGDEVIQALSVSERLNLTGQTLLVVGSRGEADTFPYGFFRWWGLHHDTGILTML